MWRYWTWLLVALIALFLGYLVATNASSAIVLWNAGNLIGALAVMICNERTRS